MRGMVYRAGLMAAWVSLASIAWAGFDPCVDAVQAAMKRSTGFMRSISTNGGYCGIYSADLKQRFGEATYERARATEIWVQPPGTPSVGQCWLEAWRVTRDPAYREAAREVARALAWGQRRIGGWDHRVDVAHLRPDAAVPVRRDGHCSFDDNVTQGALAFLIDADAVLDEPWLTEGIELGLRFMMDSQFANGAWPQWYPLRGGYHDYYTFNDGAINDCITVMLKAHAVYGQPEYLASARRGGDFIIASQGPPDQAGWAQQYDHEMKPAWARRFEPPGYCSAVTANNIRTLVELYLATEDEQYLGPIPAAIRWLEASPIAPNRWARLYEVGTNRPIYGDRENGNKIIYDYQAVSERERTSYGWQGEYGIPSAMEHYRRVRQAGAAAWNQRTQSADPPSRSATERALRDMAPQVQRVLDALDDEGRWVTDGMIHSRTFVRNFTLLCRYVQQARSLSNP